MKPEERLCSHKKHSVLQASRGAFELPAYVRWRYGQQPSPSRMAVCLVGGRALQYMHLGQEQIDGKNGPMTGEGFEPSRIATCRLERHPLDLSGTQSVNLTEVNWLCNFGIFGIIYQHARHQIASSITTTADTCQSYSYPVRLAGQHGFLALSQAHNALTDVRPGSTQKAVLRAWRTPVL